MIEVNLLPPELRPLDRTPLPRLLSILGGVAITGLEVVWLLLLFKKTIPDEEWTVKQKRGNLKTLAPQTEKLNKIKAETAEFVQHETEILALLKKRRRWTPTLDRLASLVPEKVWLTRLNYTPPKPGASGEGDYLELKCQAYGSRNQLNQIRLKLEIKKSMAEFERNIIGDTTLPENPYGLAHVFGKVRTVGIVTFEKVLRRRDTTVSDIPTFVGKFTLRLHFKPQPDPTQ